MISLKSCPNCHGDQINEFRKTIQTPVITYGIMPGVKVDAVIINRYCVCERCSLIFQNPRLSDSELGIFYSRGYYRRMIDSTDEQKDNNEAHRAKTDSEIIKKYTGGVTSHLDIGGSRGYLLHAVGAELKVNVDQNVGYSRIIGLEVYADMDKVPHKSFDLVTAVHVLEHVPDPLGFLKKMAKFIGKNGHLVIEVPTWESPGGPLRLAHLYHFESEVLIQMCSQMGLQVVHMELTPHLMLICKLDF